MLKVAERSNNVRATDVDVILDLEQCCLSRVKTPVW